MKTDDLIAVLARGVTPVDAHATRKRFQTALVWGVLGALAVMLSGYGIRHDLAQAAALPMFWVKLAFPLAISIPAVLLTVRLSRPGMPLGKTWMALPLPWLVIAGLAIATLASANPDERSALVMGKSWLSCAFNIACVSAPVLVGMLWAVKGMAPTRPALAGACAGLASAAAGAVVYTLHCPEMQAPFLAVWYMLGMLIPTAVGAVLGAKLLRW
ncbi:MAG: DUF1109 domain-containing protein [Pseudomonadota bacterium]